MSTRRSLKIRRTRAGHAVLSHYTVEKITQTPNRKV